MQRTIPTLVLARYYDVKVLPISDPELVERAQFGQLHDQHEVLHLADANHADDVGVVQLLHDVGLAQHVLPQARLVVRAGLQDLYSHLLLALLPEPSSPSSRKRWSRCTVELRSSLGYGHGVVFESGEESSGRTFLEGREVSSGLFAMTPVGSHKEKQHQYELTERFQVCFTYSRMSLSFRSSKGPTLGCMFLGRLQGFFSRHTRPSISWEW
ncbi:hypothetical protein CRUP_035458 [Coryphaenoides rupestris]|nr:hypothetical protein CRUP_035458 [Coryphaenoides rupestris]